MSIQRGNVLLFKSPSTWYEKLICWATRGPYFHAAIALDESRIIEATARGIQIDRAPINPNTFTAIDITPYTTQSKIDEALVWAIQQKGDPYGWSDILFQALKFMWPNNPMRFGISGHLDCSDFACRYLIHAGVSVSDSMLDSYTVTPNDLWRLFAKGVQV